MVPSARLEIVRRAQRHKEPDCETTSRAGTRIGLSDPAVKWNCRRSTDKGTPGITGLSSQESIDGRVWHLDVGSSHPGAEAGPKG